MRKAAFFLSFSLLHSHSLPGKFQVILVFDSVTPRYVIIL